MSKQSKTLRQVDELAAAVLEAAAVEIRRLHAQRDALLEALKEVVAFTGAHGGPYVQARAAIKQAEDFSPEAIRATQAAWKMGYDARKAEENT